MNKYVVILYYIDEYNIKHFINRGIYFANSKLDAEECAIQNWWDPRLEAASCSPCIDIQLIDED